MLAIEASLSEIKPFFIANAPNEDIKWNERSVLWLRENILDGEFIAQVTYLNHSYVLLFYILSLMPLLYFFKVKFSFTEFTFLIKLIYIVNLLSSTEFNS